MGIIKTAMYAGAGMYAVNKIAKTAENRRHTPPQNGSRNSQPQYIDNTNPRSYSYYAPPGQEQQKGQIQMQAPNGQPLQFEDHRSPDRQGQPLYLTNNAHSPLPQVYNSGMQYGYEYDPRGAAPQYQPVYQRTGSVEPDEVSESEYQQGWPSQRNGSGSTAFLSTLALQAMAMGSGDDKKGRKGKDLVGKFLGK